MFSKTRTIHLIGSIDETLYETFTRELYDLEQESDEPVHIELYSEGGYASVALAFCARMRLSTCDLHVTGVGAVTSAAVLILASGDVRKLTAETQVIVHEDQIDEKFRGNVTQLEERAEAYRRQENHWNQLMEDRTGTSAEIWANLHLKDTYLSPTTCKQLGLIHEIV